MKRQKQRGLTIVETTISASLVVVVLIGANAMMSASSGVAQSTNNLGVASNRADNALQVLADGLRRGSVASVLHLNDTYFTENTTDVGFRIREVSGFEGIPELSSAVTYRFDRPAGALEGSIIRSQDGIERVIVNGVASFTVSRAGNLFTFAIQTRSGPSDDRLRSIRAWLQVAARNP